MPNPATAQTVAGDVTGARSRPGGRGAWLWLAAVVTGALATVIALAVARDSPGLFAVLERPGRGATARDLLSLGQISIAVLAMVVAVAAAVTRARRGAAALSAVSIALLLRLSACLALAVLAGLTLADPAGRFDERPELALAFEAEAWLGLLLAVAAVLLARPHAFGPPAGRLARAIDLAAFNVLVVLVASEATLWILPRLSSSPLLQFDATAASAGDRHAEEMIRRFRLRPHVSYFDGLTNRGGFVDDEFFVADPDDFAVAVIADSFGVGAVAPRFNFVAEIERELQRDLGGRFKRVVANNFGVSAAGFPEYYRLLVDEALPRRPALVVLCVFVGNDLWRPLLRAGAAPYAVLRNWRSYQLCRRLRRIAIDRLSTPTSAAAGRLPRAAAWVPRSRPLFLDIERQGLEICNTASRSTELDYQASFAALRRFSAVLGDRLLVAIIPDSFQVDDALWAELLAAEPAAASYDRGYPQRRLLGFCRQAGVRALDLRPRLVEAQRSGATYVVNDTHWNRLGNAVAGAAIAEEILRTQGAATSGPTPEPQRGDLTAPSPR